MLEIKGNVYVVVCERDDKDWNMMNQGPIVLETYVYHATKERAARRIKNLNGQLGECRIARLVFEDDPTEGNQTPQMVTLEILLPSAMFFSVFAAVSRLYGEAEMDAMHAAGVSRLRILESVFKLSVVIATVTGLISIEGRPWAYRESYRLEAEAAAEFDLKKMATGEFVTIGSGDYVFIADDVDMDSGRHQRVFLQRQAEDGSRAELIYAESAELPTLNLDQGMTARFYNGVNYSLDNQAQRDVSMVFEKLTIRLPPSEARERYRRRAQSTASLSTSTDPKDIAEYQWRLTTPMATILLSLIAVPLARSRPREPRTRGFLTAMGAYLLLFSVSSITRTAIEEGRMGAIPGIWAAYAFFALFLMILLYPPRMPRWRRA